MKEFEHAHCAVNSVFARLGEHRDEDGGDQTGTQKTRGAGDWFQLNAAHTVRTGWTLHLPKIAHPKNNRPFRLISGS